MSSKEWLGSALEIMHSVTLEVIRLELLLLHTEMRPLRWFGLTRILPWCLLVEGILYWEQAPWYCLVLLEKLGDVVRENVI